MNEEEPNIDYREPLPSENLADLLDFNYDDILKSQRYSYTILRISYPEMAIPHRNKII